MEQEDDDSGVVEDGDELKVQQRFEEGKNHDIIWTVENLELFNNEIIVHELQEIVRFNPKGGGR